jgi:hypothetical protein
MKFRELQLACTCGQAPTGKLTLGLTSEYELVIHWDCEDCGQSIYAVKSLADCCRECPEIPPESRDTEAEDAEFLRSLGISA